MLLNGLHTSTELLPQKYLAFREPREWGELRVSLGAMPLLGLALPDSNLAPGPSLELSTGDIPPLNITIGTSSELPAIDLKPGDELDIFKGYNHRRNKPAQMHVLLANTSTLDQPQKFEAILDTVAPVLRQWLPTMPEARESYRITTRASLTKHLAVAGTVAYIFGESLMRGDLRWVEYIGGAAIVLTGLISAELEKERLTGQLQQSLSHYRQLGSSRANNIVTDLGQRFAAWQSDVQPKPGVTPTR